MNHVHMQKKLTKLATEIHAANVKVGWWNDWPVKEARYKTAMMLVVSEIVEAMEGYRKNLQDDHLPQYRMFEVELADTLIRLLDLVGAFELKFYQVESAYADALQRMQGEAIPEQLFSIVKTACARQPFAAIQRATMATIAVADLNNVDIWTIVEAKRAYNATRLDHKAEARSKPGGKAF